ncbi:ras-related and estrogen-regulated growth inhibitor-like [Babylonia areolata]|uniref:ras-related and estrogen-regulated growth inhibitor-like n=1 Tax=Babylonia areolata TaxID=304850 RepID=UPI003FD2E1BC
MSHNVGRAKLSGGGQRGAGDRGEGKDITCKMAVLGCSGVGKTALTVRFLTKRFIGEYCPTLESVHQYQTVIEEEDVTLEILDTAGQGIYPWKDGYALWADCFILVYSLTDRHSFQELQHIRRQLENVRKSSAIIAVLAANKSDLLHDRQVSRREGEALAEELGWGYHELSASEGSQVEAVADMFRDLCRQSRADRHHREGRQRKTSSSAKLKHAIQKVISGKAPTRRS